MNSLFNFNTIYTRLEPKTKSLIITLNREERENEINFETLFEIETCLNWAYSKVEILSILINSSDETFSRGFSREKLKSIEHAKIKKYREKLLSIQKLILTSPQTVIFDLGRGASNIALEMSFAADIIIAHYNADMRLDNLKMGVPLFHYTHISRSKWGQQFLNNCLYLNDNCVTHLRHSGFIAHSYYDSPDEITKKILENCAQQSPLTKTQTKSMINYSIIKNLESDFGIETNFFNASISIEDWKRDTFQSPRDVKSQVKLTLIKSEEQ